MGEPVGSAARRRQDVPLQRSQMQGKMTVTIARADAFIFDMDGTLIDNAAFHVKSWQRFFAELDHSLDERQVTEIIAGRTNAEILRIVLGREATEATMVELATRKEELYRQLYGPHLRPVEGAVPFLAQAQRERIPLALATSAGRRNIDFALDGLRLRSFFPVVVGAEDVQRSKPYPEAFLTAAAHLGVAPQHCLVFEDSPAGVEAARRAGMRIILRLGPEREDLSLLPGVEETITDFRGLRIGA